MGIYPLQNWKKILVFGAHGQLAQSFKKFLPENKTRFVGQSEVSFENLQHVENCIMAEQPDLIFNCAAYTAVDRAESDEERAHRSNVLAPAIIAKTALQIGAVLVHFSTDYVFDGREENKYSENHSTNPLNVYGKTKLAGEIEIQKILKRSFIFRTSWVYSEFGQNFVKTMLQLFHEKENLRVVNDQWGGPTYAVDLAEALTAFFDRNSKSSLETLYGLYHLTGDGECSWYDLAQRILAEAQDKGLQLKIKTIEPTSTAEFPRPAQRPQNSRLDVSLAKTRLGIVMPSWAMSLQKCMGQLLGDDKI